MNIQEWREVEHSNDVFGLRLDVLAQQMLRGFCSALANDDRYLRTGGYALERDEESRMTKHILSARLVRAAVEISQHVDDEMETIFRATDGIQNSCCWGDESPLCLSLVDLNSH